MRVVRGSRAKSSAPALLVNRGVGNVEKYREYVSEESKVAQIRSDGRKDLETTVAVLDQLSQTLVTEATQNIVDALSELSASIDRAQFIEPEQGEKIKKLIKSKILERTKLTEYVSGKLRPMSHKSEIELKLAASKALASINWKHFKLDTASYVHFDELVKRYDMHFRIIRQGLQQLRELLSNHKPEDPDPVQTVFDWMSAEHRRIWEGTKTGAKR